MYRSSTLLLALSFLAGCPEEPVSILPVPDTAPVLSSGEYVVTVESVNRWECRELDKRDVIGLEMDLSLAIKGGSANGELDDLPLRGQSEPGFVYLDGSFDRSPSPDPVYEEGEPDHEDGEPDHQDESDDDSEDAGDTSVSATPKCEEGGDSGQASAKCGGGDEPDVAEPESDVSLDLDVINPRSASGILIVRLPQCAVEVNVSAKWVGQRGSRPEEPVRPDEPHEEHDEDVDEVDEGEDSNGCDGGRGDCA